MGKASQAEGTANAKETGEFLAQVGQNREAIVIAGGKWVMGRIIGNGVRG